MHRRTGKLANTIPCFKEVTSTKHTRGSCQLHKPNRLQSKEVRNNLDTPGNTHKALEPHHFVAQGGQQLFKHSYNVWGRQVWLQQLGCPKKPHQPKIAQLALVRFLICSYICLYSPCIGRGDPGFFRYLDAERTGIKTSMAVLKEEEGGRHTHQCLLAPGWESPRNILLHRWVTTASAAVALPIYPVHHRQQHCPAQNGHILWTDFAWPWVAFRRMPVLGERQGTAIYWELDTFKTSLSDQNLQCSKSLANVM